MPLTGLVEKNNSLVWWQNVEAPSAFLAFSSFGFFFFNLEIDMSNKEIYRLNIITFRNL